MYENNHPIISATELKKILPNKNLVILDARTGKEAYQNYLEKHIEGAKFIDLEKDLSDIPKDASKGGRHPLPSLFDFAKTLSDLGVSESSHVVIYDDKAGTNAAARCWWMLKSFGIEKAQVLDGGLQAAENEQISFSSGKEETYETTLKVPEKWLLPTLTLEEVESETANQLATVIDVRDAYRFRGDSEPIDLIAGHIPGAINIPLSENLDENGFFLKPDVLRKKYQTILGGKSTKLIVHCGSGVTACHTILALTSTGFDIPNLYVGSWSEWSRRNKPIATAN